MDAFQFCRMLPWFENGNFPLYLAPMAGFTDIVFRQMCRQNGADVVVSEFVLADAVTHGDIKVWSQIDLTEDQRPMGVQLFGSEPEVMGEAAKMLRDRLQPDFIDINYGCPARKVTCKNAGSSLLRDLPLLQSIARGVVEAVPDVPVTAKIRIGWDSENIVAKEAGECLQDVGIQALAIHGRTKTQGYKGDANWDVIYEVADVLDIPVIGNGSLKDSYDVKRIRDESQVSGLMIGRAALGNPWIFKQIKLALETGEALKEPGVEERWDFVIRYAETLTNHYKHLPMQKCIGILRSRIVSFLYGFHRARSLRNQVARCHTLDELKAVRDEHMADWNAYLERKAQRYQSDTGEAAKD